MGMGKRARPALVPPRVGSVRDSAAAGVDSAAVQAVRAYSSMRGSNPSRHRPAMSIRPPTTSEPERVLLPGLP